MQKHWLAAVLLPFAAHTFGVVNSDLERQEIDSLLRVFGGLYGQNAYSVEFKSWNAAHGLYAAVAYGVGRDGRYRLAVGALKKANGRWVAVAEPYVAEQGVADDGVLALSDPWGNRVSGYFDAFDSRLYRLNPNTLAFAIRMADSLVCRRNRSLVAFVLDGGRLSPVLQLPVSAFDPMSEAGRCRESGEGVALSLGEAHHGFRDMLAHMPKHGNGEYTVFRWQPRERRYLPFRY